MMPPGGRCVCVDILKDAIEKTHFHMELVGYPQSYRAFFDTRVYTKSWNWKGPRESFSSIPCNSGILFPNVGLKPVTMRFRV